MEALRKRRWSLRLTGIAALLCFGAVAAALAGAIGAGRDLWHFRTGFKILEYAIYAGVLGILIALAAIFFSWRARPRLALVNLLAIVAAGIYLAFIGNQIVTARSVPAIHDVSTNLDDWPRFYRLRVRDDNLENVPDMGRPELAAMEPRERWKAIHREHYGDIATIRVPWSVQETLSRARDLAEERGWEIVTYDIREGILEAVDTSLFFRFEDNVIVRVRPVTEGNGSVVDMRSISRVGVSDVGVNAERVRDFLADLQRG